MTAPTITSYRDIANRMRTGFARAGSQQSHTRLFTPTEDPKGKILPGEVCALGALCLGSEPKNKWMDYQDTDRYWPATATELKNVGLTCPVSHHMADSDGDYDEECGEYFVEIEDIVIHLNDEHRWSINEIADFLTTLDKDAA